MAPNSPFTCTERSHNQLLLSELIQKYNTAGPRYTSYPTAVQFSETFDRRQLKRELQRRAEQIRPLSLYVHIPFCFSLCWYCGCTKIITRDQDRGDSYLDYLQKEIRLLKETLHPDSPVRQIHFGGGTPTFLTPSQLRTLGDTIHTHFTLDQNIEFSVEIDPRRCTEAHIEALHDIGCNRASIGVQDTNPEVQRAIHRIQPVELTRKVIGWLQAKGIGSINMDLIYGLPKQTLSTFQRTIDDVTALDPDRMAIYSYAHLPSRMPSQKLLDTEDLPSADEKLQMLTYSIDTLPDLGYRFIGMDHFAKEKDELALAMDNGTLHRNFQGYSTHASLEMVALGMSGISMGDRLYMQNEKDLARYYRMLDEGEIPVRKILPLTPDDRLRRDLIMKIMCHATIRYDLFEAEYGVDFKSMFTEEMELLRPMEEDRLVEMLDDRLVITKTGRMFVRNIAMVFDRYLAQTSSSSSYSKTV